MLWRFKLYIFLFLLWFFSRWRDTWPRRNRTRSPFASASCVQFLESHIPTGCSFIFISFSRRLRRRIIIKPWFGLIFNGRLPLSSTELILLFFIAIAWTVEFFFLFHFFMHDILNQVRITLYLRWHNQLWPFLGKTVVFVIIYSFDVLVSYS